MFGKQLKNAKALLKDTLIETIGPNAYWVFLFGSRAVGTNSERSDYDIGILGKNKLPLRELARIKNKLEDLPLVVNVDIVDFNRVSEDFKRIALEKIEIWNKPKIDLPLV